MKGGLSPAHPLLFTPPLASPRLPTPLSPVAERQVPANCAAQAPQDLVQQRRRLCCARPLVGRERSAAEILSRLQPALLLGRSRETSLQRHGAGRARSRAGTLTAALGSAMTAPGAKVRITALPWRRGGGKRAGRVSASSLRSGQWPPPEAVAASEVKCRDGGGGSVSAHWETVLTPHAGEKRNP